jgi:hypothetical protein
MQAIGLVTVTPVEKFTYWIVLLALAGGFAEC